MDMVIASVLTPDLQIGFQAPCCRGIEEHGKLGGATEGGIGVMPKAETRA